MYVREYSSSARDVVVLVEGLKIFQFTGKLIIFKHWYTINNISGVFCIDLRQPIKILYCSGESNTNQNLKNIGLKNNMKSKR